VCTSPLQNDVSSSGACVLEAAGSRMLAGLESC
jgi:hypothetical protein